MTAATDLGDRMGDRFSKLVVDWQRRRRRARSVPLSTAAVTLTWAALALAGLALWTVVFSLGLSALSEHHAQHGLYSTFRQELADGTAPLGGDMTRGKPVALLDASPGGLHGIVAVEGTGSTELRNGPGHYPGTVLPGQPGTTVFMARSASFGGAFGGISKLHTGDVIKASTQQGDFHYRVLDVRGPGDPIPVPPADAKGTMVLITSEGSGWRSVWSPTHAVYVDAVLTDATTPSPASVGVTRASDYPMRGDTGVLIWLLLWMQLLVIVVVGIVIASRKIDFWRVWLVAGPVVLAVLWGTTQTAWGLLPNLI